MFWKSKGWSDGWAMLATAHPDFCRKGGVVEQLMLFQDVAGALLKWCVVGSRMWLVPLSAITSSLLSAAQTIRDMQILLILGFNNPQNALRGPSFRKLPKSIFSIKNCKEKCCV